MDAIQTILAEELGQASTAKHFEYGSQPLGPDEVRVLVLRPDRFRDDETDIHCYMARMNLAAAERFGLEKHPFVALSYVWGAEEDQKMILIDCKKKEVT